MLAEEAARLLYGRHGAARPCVARGAPPWSEDGGGRAVGTAPGGVYPLLAGGRHWTHPVLRHSMGRAKHLRTSPPKYIEILSYVSKKAHTPYQRCQFMEMVGGGGRLQISPTYLSLFFLLGFRPLYFKVQKKD